MYEWLRRCHARRDSDVLALCRYFAPGARIGEAIGQARTQSAGARPPSGRCTRQRGGRVEDAALHPLSLVVLLEEELVEVDYRIFLGVPVTEVPNDGLHVAVVEELDDVIDAELVEVDPGPPVELRLPPT